MKRTLALLIAVLMVVAMLPLSTFAAAGQAIVGAPAPEGNQATDKGSTDAQQTPPAPTSDDYFAVYDENDAWVGYYATLAEADAALQDGYTLKILQSYTADAAYVWGECRADKTAPIHYTVDGALADGGNAVITANAANAWTFTDSSWGDQITLKNITMIAAHGAINAWTSNPGLTIGLELENCKIYAGGSYYEVDPSAYAAAPVQSTINALDVTNATLRVLGAETVVRATNAATVFATNSTVYVENGYFYSSAAEYTVYSYASQLYVMDATVVNNAQSALWITGGNAYIHAGTFAVTADVAATLGGGAAIMADENAKVIVTGAVILAGGNVYALSAQTGASIELYRAEIAAASVANKMNGAVVKAATTTTILYKSTITLPVVGEGTAQAPAHKVAVTDQEEIVPTALAEGQATALRVYTAKGDLVAYLPAEQAVSASVLSAFVLLVPNGGKLVVDADISLDATASVAYGAPKMAITIEGGENGAKIQGAVEGYLLALPNDMEITLKNISIQNADGQGVCVGDDENGGLNTKNAVLTLSKGASVLAAQGEAVAVMVGATVKLEDDAFVQSALLATKSATVVVEAGATFEMNGENAAVKAPAVQGATAFLSREAARSLTVGEGENAVTYTRSFSHTSIRLNNGDVILPAKVVSLHQLADTAVVGDLMVAPKVDLRSAADDTFLYNNKEAVVELLNGENHIGYYNSIAEALTDVKDGYTVKLLDDHIETSAISTDFEEITWTLDGNGKKLYMPEMNDFGMEFGGKNTKAEIKNFTLYAGGNGITVNPAAITAGVGVVATDVFVYAAGADEADADAFVGDPVKKAAFRVENKGGELIIVGDASGAYINGQCVDYTYLVYNGGYLSVYGGKYDAPVARVVETFGSGATTYIAGGDFIGAEGGIRTIYNRASANTIVVGGNFVTKTGETINISSGTAKIYGGNFYHLSAGNVTSSASRTTYYGGTFHFDDAALAQEFADSADAMSGRQISETTTYALTEELYGLSVGTVLSTMHFEENEVWMDVNGYKYGVYAVKVYTGKGEDFIGVYGDKENGANLTTALQMVGPYNGKLEFQFDVNRKHTSETASRVMGPIAKVTLTSAPGECFTYASSKYKGSSTGDGYFLRLHGGTWVLENLTLANYGSQLLSVHADSQSYAKLIIAEGGELSGHTSVVLMADNTGLIVEEGGFANVSATQNMASGVNYGRLPASSNIVRLEGGADVTVYGSLGYYRDGTLPDNGAYRCINYNGAADAVAGTGEQCTIYLGATAKLGTPIGTKTLPVINVDIADTSVLHDILVKAEGATFATDAYVVNATAGTQVVMDGVTIQNTVAADSFTGAKSSYAFVMNGAGGEFKNIKYTGTSFMSIDSVGMPKQDALTITFNGENEIVGKSSAVLWNVAASCNTDLVIDGGYYQSEVGNFLYATADEVDGVASEGKLTINDGTFYKDNGNNVTMFLCYGSYDVVVEGGFFHLAYNALMFGMLAASGKAPCTTELTINGGEFEIWYGWMYSDESATNETKLTINDCHVMAESGVDYAGTARTATGILRIGGKCEAVINGGIFETEQFATNKTCDIIQSRHTASIVINDWTVYHRSGNESAVRVLGDSNVTVNGGWIESNGRFVVRTMAGSNTATALKTPSKAILKVYGGTMILNPSHPMLSTSSSNCVIANGGSEQFGHVYIYGGQFINRNDADRVTPDSGYSRQVLGLLNPYGDFEVHGGIMIATAVQDYFYTVDSTNPNATGVSIPSVNLPIVKGVTPTYEVDGRDYYYVVYGMGDSLLVPELQTSFAIDVAEGGNGLVFTAAMDATQYAALITWARAHAFAYNKQFDANTTVADNYTLKFGMLITTVDALLKTGGSIDVSKLESVGALCLDKPVDAKDAVANEDGTLDISAIVENIPVTDNTVQFMAVPYVEIMLGVGTAQIITERHFGEYNSNAGVASMASVAATLLRDNTDVQVGAYQYPSVTVKNAFNRYTVEQQEVLVTYLAHEHSFDYKGVCQDAECGANIAVALPENQAQTIYTENGTVKFYELSLKKDATYTFGFTKDVVAYTLYNANGVACTVTAGKYVAAEDGTYYLCVKGKTVGNTQLLVTHIHDANHLGECAVCGQTLSEQLAIDEKQEPLYVKQNFYFYNVELAAGVDYQIALINGTYRLYDAEGNEQALTGGNFSCVTAGTYYIVVEATYTAKASLCVNHVHNYNYMGVCSVENCGKDITVVISGAYKYTPAMRVESGERLYFAIYMTAGLSYTLKPNRNLGRATLSYATVNEEGVEEIKVFSLSDNNDTFACEKDGIYYVSISVAETVNNAQVSFEVVHDCTYNDKGECVFQHTDFNGNTETVSCGKTNRVRLYDNEKQNAYMEPGQKYYFYFNYAGAGISYVIDLPVEGVEYALYDEDGNKINSIVERVNETDSTRTADVYLDENADRILYMVVTYTGTEADTVILSMAHIHAIDHTGVCAAKDTTKGASCALTYRKVLELDKAVTVEYTAGTTYYYELKLQAGTEYKVLFENCAGLSWVVKDLNGALVMDSADGNVFTIEASDYYYLAVTATENSAGTEEVPATVTVQSHAHTINNTGACSCGYEKSAFVIDLDQLLVDGGMKVGQLSAGKYYLRATMVAGKTYSLKFTVSVGEVTYKLYGGENADVEMTVTDGVFTCTESGSYCYVAEVSRATAAVDSIAYSVDGSVAHVHTFSSAYHYVQDGEKFYRVIDKCDMENCDASWREEVAALTADTALEIAYVTRGCYYYAIALQAGKTYTVNFENSPANWTLVNADGSKLADSEGGAYLCEADGVYYLEVVATSKSNNKHGAKATLTVVGE